MPTSNFFIKLLESFFGRGSFIVFTLLFSLISTRLYGVEIFGIYTYAFAIAQVVMVLPKAGLDNGLIYSIPKHKYKHVSFSFITNFIISWVLILLVWIFCNDIYIKFMIPLIWLISAERLFFGIYRIEGRIKEYYFINGFLTMLLRVILIISLYYLTGGNAYSIAIGVYISFVFSNILYLIQNNAKFKKPLFDKDYLKYSLALVLATVMDTLIYRSDILMLGIMSTNTNVGIYQITVQVSNVLSSLLLIFNTVFAPEISKLYHNNKKTEMKNLYKKAARYLTVLSFLITILLIIGSHVVLKIFGSEIVEGQTALILRSLGQFLNVAVGGVWLMLSMTGEPRFQMYANIFAFAINIILNFTLIPVYGINGAAFASMITIIFTNLVGYIIVSRKFDVKVFKFF